MRAYNNVMCINKKREDFDQLSPDYSRRCFKIESAEISK